MLCPSVPFPRIYPHYPLSFIMLFPEFSFVPSDLSSHLKYSLPGLMEHHHGEHMMSLHWEQLPRKPYDVIALETVAVVTELAEGTGKKGFVIWQVPGNVPLDENKEDTFIYIFILQGGLPVVPRAHFFFWYNVLHLGYFLLVCVILLMCFYCWMLSWTSSHNKMGKSYIVLCFCVRWVPTSYCCLIFPVWFLLFLWRIMQCSYYPSRCQSNCECHTPQLASSAPGSGSVRNSFSTSFLPFPISI